jgi:membrane protein DedA with SNARE-associated domain
MAGSLVGYWSGRLLLGRFGGYLAEAPTAIAVFLSRPVPVFAEALSLAAGAQRMRPALFVTVAAAGNLLYAAALTANGAALLPSALAGPGLILPMLLPVVAWLLWRRFACAARPSANGTTDPDHA